MNEGKDKITHYRGNIMNAKTLINWEMKEPLGLSFVVRMETCRGNFVIL